MYKDRWKWCEAVWTVMWPIPSLLYMYVSLILIDFSGCFNSSRLMLLTHHFDTKESGYVARLLSYWIGIYIKHLIKQYIWSYMYRSSEWSCFRDLDIHNLLLKLITISLSYPMPLSFTIMIQWNFEIFLIIKSLKS